MSAEIKSALEARREKIAIEIVDPYANNIAARIGDSHLAKAKQATIHTLTLEDYLILL